MVGARNTMAGELEDALADKERALAKETQGLVRESKLRERLLAAGIDPDSK